MSIQLNDKKLEQLSQQPIVESSVQMSEDGKWVVHKTTITDIKSRGYFDKVLGDAV